MPAGLTTSHWPATTGADVDEPTTGGLLRRAAATAPDRIALAEIAPAASLTGAARSDRTWTYRELLADATRCAHWLLRRFRPGERIVVWAPNVPEWVILQYGAALAGLVLVTANPALRTGELAYVVSQSRASGVFFVDAFRDTDMAAAVTEVAGRIPGLRRVSFTGWARLLAAEPSNLDDLPAVSPGDPAQIQYTSGTTGFAKGVLLHHRGLVTNAAFVAGRAGFPPGGTWVTAVPMFHTGGSAMSLLGCASVAGTFGLCQSFAPELKLRAIQDLRAELVVAVPTMLLAMLERPDFDSFDLSRCRVVVSGGAPVPAELVHRVESRFGAKLVTVYGQTEIGAIATMTSPADTPEDRAGTVGRPLPRLEIKVTEPGAPGVTVPVGAVGEICFRGYQRMLGYFELPAETAAVAGPDGWLRSGDLGRLDGRGYLSVTGRLRDLVIRGGENIYPREIEDLLRTHRAVADVVVVGVPDEHWGEELAAVLRPCDEDRPPSVEELRALCRGALAAHKTPKFWYTTAEFPLTGSGKIQKFRVRELIASAALPELPAALPELPAMAARPVARGGLPRWSSGHDNCSAR